MVKVDRYIESLYCIVCSCPNLKLIFVTICYLLNCTLCESQGIVVDIPLAPFFLSHLLKRNHSSYYNYLDELSSFDEQIYSSLNFIKVQSL